MKFARRRARTAFDRAEEGHLPGHRLPVHADQVALRVLRQAISSHFKGISRSCPRSGRHLTETPRPGDTATGREDVGPRDEEGAHQEDERRPGLPPRRRGSQQAQHEGRRTRRRQGGVACQVRHGQLFVRFAETRAGPTQVAAYDASDAEGEDQARGHRDHGAGQDERPATAAAPPPNGRLPVPAGVRDAGAAWAGFGRGRPRQTRFTAAPRSRSTPESQHETLTTSQHHPRTGTSQAPDSEESGPSRPAYLAKATRRYVTRHTLKRNSTFLTR